jgi:hypothetical protein
MTITARIILLVATLLLMNLLVTSIAQHILELNKPYFERSVIQSLPAELTSSLESQTISPSLKDLIPTLWRSNVGYSTLRLIGFLALSIFALVILRTFSTNEELKRTIALLFPIGVILLPLGMMLAYYVPNNLGAATALTGAISLIITIIDASIHLHGGTRN